MFSVQWLGARGLNRGKPGLPGGHGRRLAVLAMLMAATVFETGCQSSLCGPCGVVGRTTSFITRPFHRNRAGRRAAAPNVSDGGCISSGVPVEAGARSSCRGRPSFPAAATPSNVLPPDNPVKPGAAAQREIPARHPRGRSGGCPASTGSKTGSSYETHRPDYPSSRTRGDNLAHTLISTPVPAARSAQDVASSTGAEVRGRPAATACSTICRRSTCPPRSARRPRRRRWLRRRSGSRRLRPRRATIPVVARRPSPTRAQPGCGAARPPSPRRRRGRGARHRPVRRRRPQARGREHPLDGRAELAGREGVQDPGGSPRAVRDRRRLHRRGHPPRAPLHRPAHQPEVDRQDARRPVQLRARPQRRPSPLLLRHRRRPGPAPSGTSGGSPSIGSSSQIARREAEELGLNNADYWLAATRYLEHPERPAPRSPRRPAPPHSRSENAAKPSAGSTPAPRLETVQLPRQPHLRQRPHPAPSSPRPVCRHRRNDRRSLLAASDARNVSSARAARSGDGRPRPPARSTRRTCGPPRSAARGSRAGPGADGFDPSAGAIRACWTSAAPSTPVIHPRRPAPRSSVPSSTRDRFWSVSFSRTSTHSPSGGPGGPRRSPSRPCRPCPSRNWAESRPAALLVRASRTTPEVGRSSRWTSPTNTLPGFSYRSFRYAARPGDEAPGLPSRPPGRAGPPACSPPGSGCPRRGPRRAHRRTPASLGDSLHQDRRVRPLGQLEAQPQGLPAGMQVVVDERRTQAAGEDERRPRPPWRGRRP